MRTIWKYDAPRPGCEVVHSVPGDPVFRRVMMQGSTPEIWLEVETTNVAMPRTYLTTGTGEPVPRTATYVGTYAHPPDANLPDAWHVWELEA